ncbi:MAG: ArsR family transcriptional regulator [Candidatus Methanospirareceae archaeon]
MRRARLINDPVDMVPLLRVFCDEKNKRIFEELVSGWKTEKELEEDVGGEVRDALMLLEESNLLECSWRMPKPGEKPEKEYHTSYTKIIANFQCSLKDLGDLLRVVLMEEEKFKEVEEPLIEAISSNKSVNSISTLSKHLNLSPVFLKAIIKRSSRLCIKGQRIELL